MINLRFIICAFLTGALAAACGSAPAPSPSSATPTPRATASAVATVNPAPTPNETVSARPSDMIPTLTNQEQQLDPGTYRLELNNFASYGVDFPAMLITVPDGWGSGGWNLGREGIAVLFWDVFLVYGHPCQWQGTLWYPGPTVDDLADALVDVPLRHATDPVAVTLDGYSGKYLEWSVPDDMEVDDDGNFVDCDGSGGIDFFESWTANGWASDRYQQAAGQIDRLWILDVGGPRLVIDAFEMPDATRADREELTTFVESIRFER